MTEGLVKQSIAELRDFARCRRYMVDAVQVVADRIEELEADLQDAHRVGAEWFEQSKQNHKRATTAEAKLSKAMEALDEAWFMLTVPHLNYEPEPEEPGLRRIKTALAELNGEK